IQLRTCSLIFFLSNPTPPSQISTLSLHDALPIFTRVPSLLFFLVELSSLAFKAAGPKPSSALYAWSIWMTESLCTCTYSVFCACTHKHNPSRRTKVGTILFIFYVLIFNLLFRGSFYISNPIRKGKVHFYPLLPLYE